MKPTHLLLLLIIALATFITGCTSDKVIIDPPEPSIGKLTLVEINLEKTLPWSGGVAELNVKTDNAEGKWQARLVINEIAGEVMNFQQGKIEIIIPQNRSEAEVSISIEGFSENKWLEFGKTLQEMGAVRVNTTAWAKGNLIVENGEFAFATDNSLSSGMFFRHNSHYAIPGEEPTYGGKAYTPAEQTIEWAKIPSQTGIDPCRLVKPINSWVTPDNAQFEELMTVAGDFKSKGELQGLFFNDEELFFPLLGVRMKDDGRLEYYNLNGGYWGRGSNEEEKGEILSISSDYAAVWYNEMDNLGVIRCVKANGVADYVSHTPEEVGSSEGFELTVNAKGDKANFMITIIGEGIYLEQEVSSNNPTAVFNIPANPELEPREMKISVDNFFSGKGVTQSGLTGYAYYKSHTPTGTVFGDPFSLSITSISDMDTFEVEVFTEDGTIKVSGNGSRDKLTVELPVPQNSSGLPRELKIKVNGQITDVSVNQEHKPEAYGEVALANVTWAKGNIILKNNEFQIGEPQEHGLYFMMNSIYGIPSNSPNYQGTVYSPMAVAYQWTLIPHDIPNDDPCNIVAPTNTWRLPTHEEIGALNSTAKSAYTLEGIQGRNYADNNLFIAATGMMDSGNQKELGNNGYIRSNSEYVMGFGKTTYFSELRAKNYGYNVRCVKRKNYADYVSHTPIEIQSYSAFTIEVVCQSDMPTFPVKIDGSGILQEKTATQAYPTVTFDIPENNGTDEREFLIYINGVNTGKSVKQMGKGLSVEWSRGYLTVKDGGYAFAEKENLGMFFKHNSKYGTPGDATYQGKTYGPAEENYASYADIPFNEIDPCTLVTPTGSWRMPSQEEFRELMKASLEVTANSIQYTVGSEIIYLAGPSGSLIATSGKPGLATYIYIHTSTLDSDDATKHHYFRSKMDVASISVDVKMGNGVGMQVRCVRDK